MVGHLDVDCGWHQKEMIIKDTLEKAIKAANQYMKHNEVEYGLSIKI